MPSDQSQPMSGAGMQVQQSDDAVQTHPLTGELVEWFSQHGGQLSTDVQIVYSKSRGFYMRALGPLSSPVVVTCPLKLTLSCLNLDPEQREVLHVSSPLQQCQGKLPDHILTYLFLIEQRSKGKESPWHAYIACLPGPEAMTTPLWFAEDDLVFLEGTSLAPAVRERKTDYRQHYDHALEALTNVGIPLAKDIKFEDLVWAATIFTSRAFISTHILPGQETVPVLFPVVDILNHSVTTKAEWDFQPHKSFSLKLLDGNTYVEGQELFNNYAPKQNDELLLGYGFCLEVNPIEQFPLRLASPVPTEYARQLGLLDPANVPFDMDPTFLSTDQTTEQHFLRVRGHPFGRYQNNVPFFRGIPPFIVHSFFMQTLLTLDIDIAAIDVQHPSSRIVLHILALLHHAISLRCLSLPIETTLSPQNDKQRFAKYYRDGQANIIHSIRTELETALNKILHPQPSLISHHPRLLSFKKSLTALQPTHLQIFEAGMQKHDLTHPADDAILWPLLLVTSLALTLTQPVATSMTTATNTPAYLTALLAQHPLPALADGITDAETYTFIDEHLSDFLRLSLPTDPSASPTDVLDDLGLAFVNQPADTEQNVFISGKTENLGVRVIMWGMSIAERMLVPIWNASDGAVEMYLYTAGEGDEWIYDDSQSG